MRISQVSGSGIARAVRGLTHMKAGIASALREVRRAVVRSTSVQEYHCRLGRSGLESTYLRSPAGR